MKAVLLALTVLAMFTGCSRKEEITTADVVKTLKEDANPDMRAWAARELGRNPGNDVPASVGALTQALQEPNEDVRAAAGYGLADLGLQAAPAVPALTKANQDRSAKVRAAAVYALKQIQPKK